MANSVTTPANQRYVLVTGAGSGLGRAFCLRLASEGWHVGVTDIDLAAAEATLAALVEAGGRGQAEQLDVTEILAWEKLLDKLRRDWPRLDLLINNAGVCAAGEIGVAPLEDFRQVLDVNFYGVLHGCQTMIPWLKQTAKETTARGHVVNIASVFGLVAPPSMGAYNASKAAVIALSETLYGELLPMGIGVTVVAPGFFASQLLNAGRFEKDGQRQSARRYMKDATISAEEVVGQTLAAIERKKLYVVLGRKSRWLWRLKRWLPAWFAKILVWKYDRRMKDYGNGD